MNNTEAVNGHGKRKIRLKVSFRFVLGAMTFVAIICALISWGRIKTQIRERAIEDACKNCQYELVYANDESDDSSAFAAFSNLLFGENAFRKVVEVKIHHGECDDLQFLEFFPNCKRLLIYDLNLTSFRGLTHVNNSLTNLTVMSCTVDSVTGLDGATSVEHIGFWNLRGIPGGWENLMQMKSVLHLDYTNSEIIDLSFLRLFPSLEVLNLAATPIDTFPSTPTLSGLTHLNVSDTLISDCSQICAFRSLLDLNIARTQIEDVTDLVQLSKLEKLRIGPRFVSGIGSVGQLESMKKLIVDHRATGDPRWDRESSEFKDDLDLLVID